MKSVTPFEYMQQRTEQTFYKEEFYRNVTYCAISGRPKYMTFPNGNKYKLEPIEA